MLEAKVLSSNTPEFIDQEAPIDIGEAHAEYTADGGQLDFYSFRFVMEFSPPEEIDLLLSHRPYRVSSAQADRLDAYTGVGLSLPEKQLYALLRDELHAGERLNSIGNLPQSLSDQCLMAEILRITSPEKMQLFMGRYPHIFGE